MSGLVGTFGWVPSQAERQAAIAALSGPTETGDRAKADQQGAGQLSASEADFGSGWLGQLRRRTANLPAGVGPVSGAPGQGIAFCGVIAGREQLLQELSPHGPIGKGSDAEVLALGFQVWGLDGLMQRLRGLFAFALWDEHHDRVHLCRDRLGQQPLYVAAGSRGWAFGSTLASLLPLIPPPHDLDRQALSNYLVAGFTPSPQTLLAGVSKLRPGHVLSLVRGRSTPASGPEVGASEPAREETGPEPSFERGERARQYWSLPEAAEAGPIPISTIQGALDAAVQRCLEGGEPVAALLGGGIDSTLVVASMARHRARVTTIAVDFPHDAGDHGLTARRTAEHFGTEHHPLHVSPSFVSEVPQFVASLSEPIASPRAFLAWHVARLARHHTSTVLTGHGGDEFFAGYRGYLGMQLAQHLGRLPSALLAGVGHLPRGRGGLQRLQALAKMSRQGGHFPLDPLGRRGFRNRLEALGAPAHASLDTIRERIWNETANPSWLRRAQRVDTLTVLPESVLISLSSAARASGVTTRSPLLDLGLVTLSLRLPDAQLIHGGRTKYALRALLRESLPSSLAPKRTARRIAPTSAWMRGTLGGLAGRLIRAPAWRQRTGLDSAVALNLLEEHRAGRRDHGRRLWSLLVLELWCRIHIDRDLDPTTPAQQMG